jgi:hypothetical protein
LADFITTTSEFRFSVHTPLNHRHGRWRDVGGSQDCPHRCIYARIYKFAMDRHPDGTVCDIVVVRCDAWNDLTPDQDRSSSTAAHPWASVTH